MEQIPRQLVRANTLEEDVFNLVIAFYEKYTVGPTIAELCKMIDILHYKPKGRTARSNIKYMVDNLYYQGYFIREEVIKGSRRTGGRIIVRDAEWRYKGAGYGKNAGKATQSDEWTTSHLLGTKKSI